MSSSTVRLLLGPANAARLFSIRRRTSASQVGGNGVTWPLATPSPAAERLRHEAADADARPDAGPRGNPARPGPTGLLPPLGPDETGAGRRPRRPALRLLHEEPGAAADL